MTVGPYTVKNKNDTQLIQDILVFFKFEEDIPCKYD